MTMPTERGSRPNVPIRSPEQGFIGESERYLAKLKQASVPGRLRRRRHSIPWPVDMTNVDAHITAYFGDHNYSVPTHNGQHEGIDIQAPIGTPILAPEDAAVVIVPNGQHNINRVRGMEDIILYSKQSGLMYVLAHVDSNSIPERIRERRWFDRDSKVRVMVGEHIGTVGIFFNDYMIDQGKPGLDGQIDIPSDVEAVYGRSYNHLHFEVHNIPLSYMLSSIWTRMPINPLGLLKQLY